MIKIRRLGITLTFLFIGIQLGFGQSVDSSLVKKITQIGDYMFSDPVTAKSELLQLLKENKNASDYNRGMICLKLATTLGMTNNLDSAFFYSQEAIRLFPDDRQEKAGSLKLIATLYRLSGDYTNAESAIIRSLSLNDSLWKDTLLKAITLQEYGGICLDQHNYFKATTLFLKAIDLISSTDITKTRAQYFVVKLRTNLAEAYLVSGNYPFAIREFTKTLQELKTFKDEEGWLRAGLQLTEAYIRNGNYKDADSLIDQLKPVASKINNEELLAYVQLKEGQIAIAYKQFSIAVAAMRKAYKVLKRNNSSSLISDCVNNYLIALSYTNERTEALGIIHDKTVKSAVSNALPVDRLTFMRLAIGFTHDNMTADETNDYYQQLLLLADSVNEQKQKESASEIQAKYQFERQQEDERKLVQENNLLKENAAFKRKQFFFFIAIALLVTLLMVMIALRLRQRTLMQSNLLKTSKQEIKFQKERNEWMEREKSFRDQLINQQRVVLTQAIADKEEMDLRLQELVKEKQEERRNELLEQLEKNKDKKLNIEILLAQFNAIHPTFGSQLLKIYPALSPADIQFCTLFRMNLTTKEISVLLNIEPRSIYKKKYRTMEKMGLGQDDDFEKVLFGIG